MIEIFVYRLIELRKQKGVSGAQLAAYLHIAPSTYAGYEQGYREPSLRVLKEIANFFECSIDYLMGREDDFGNIVLKTDAPNLSQQEQGIIATFRSLPKDLQQRAAAYIAKLGELASDEKAATVTQKDIV